MNELSSDTAQSHGVCGGADTTAEATASGVLGGWWQARYFLIDLDGTLVHQKVPADGAAALLGRLAGRYVVVSNNSTHTAAGLARELRAQGLPVPPERLVLAGEQTLHFMAERHGSARIRLVGSPALQQRARVLGCRLVDAAPEFVVLARDERFTYAKLSAIVNDLRSGARLVVTNPDLSHPALRGGVVPETGSLMRAVVDCAGVEPAHVIGKPDALLFREALRRLGAVPADTLVIGDNPQTDALGAARLGMRCLLLGASPQARAASPAALLEQS